LATQSGVFHRKSKKLFSNRQTNEKFCNFVTVSARNMNEVRNGGETGENHVRY